MFEGDKCAWCGRQMAPSASMFCSYGCRTQFYDRHDRINAEIEYRAELRRAERAAAKARRDAEAAADAHRQEMERARREQRATEELERIAQQRSASNPNTTWRQQYLWLKGLFGVLAAYEGHNGYYLIPSFPKTKLANASKASALPSTEYVLALLDTTYFGSSLYFPGFSLTSN